MRAAGKSVVGNQRKNNEDSIFVPGKNDIAKDVYIVADGMGVILQVRLPVKVLLKLLLAIFLKIMKILAILEKSLTY